MKFSVIIFLCFSFQIQAMMESVFVSPDYNFEKIDDGDDGPNCERKESYSIRNLPPVYDQAGAAICFAFSTKTILEHFICKKKSNQFCYGEADQISPAHLASLSENVEDKKLNKIYNGGDPRLVLKHIRTDQHFKVNRDRCFPFEIWDKANQKYAPRDRSLDFFESIKAKFDTSDINVRQCLAKELKTNLSLPQTEADIMNFIGLTTEEFRYSMTNPSSCLNDQIQVPEFEDFKFPSSVKDQVSKEDIVNQLEKQIRNDRPVIASLCSPLDELKNNTRCMEGAYRHSVIITGFKTVCERSRGCFKLYKVQNPWGQNWQDLHHDGWVDAEVINQNLYANSFGEITWTYSNGNSYKEEGRTPVLNWISSPNEQDSYSCNRQDLRSQNAPLQQPAPQLQTPNLNKKNEKSQRQNQISSQRKREIPVAEVLPAPDSPDSTDTPASQEPPPPKPRFYKCDGNQFLDNPYKGTNCKPMF